MRATTPRSRDGGGRLAVAFLGATDHINHFLPILPLLEPVDVVGVWDRSSEAAQAIAKAHGIRRIFEKPEDALEFADAAVIPMHGRPPKDGERWGDAPSDHLRLARIFLREAKAVFATRPFATKVEDAREMIRLARENEAPIMSCSPLRYDRSIARLRDKIKSGSLGRIRTWFPTVRTRFADRPVTIGFYGVHAIEMSYAALGRGAEWVETISTPTGDDGRRTSVFTVKFGGDRIMVGQLMDGSSVGSYRISVYGEKGVEEASPTTRYAAIPYRPWVRASAVNLRDNYFRLMFREFVKSVKTGRPAVPYDELLEITKVIAAAEASDLSGKRIHLADL